MSTEMIGCLECLNFPRLEFLNDVRVFQPTNGAAIAF